ncbi:MAG: TldD/PmbA family protein [Oscillospiraceae bacterium]|nr:TldD/PmbA family protein [Oscillospiraceae bacterium]
MDFNGFKQAVIAKCEEMNIAEYELYYQVGGSTEVGVFMHEVNEFTSSLDGGVCFRCIVDGKMGYASTQALSAGEAATVVVRAVDNAKTLEAEDEVFLGEGGQTYEPLELTPCALPTTEELIATTLKLQEALYAKEGVVDGCQSQGIMQESKIAIFNSKGLDLSYENSAAGLITVAVVSNGKEMENAFKFKLGKLEEIDIDEMTEKAAEEARRQLGGDVAPTGQYPVIFSPKAMSSLLQVFSSIFSSEAAQKGLSKLAGQEGEKIASDLVTLVDDPFHKENPEPMNFDAEGSPAHCKNVIEKGVLTTLLYNLKTAHKAGKKTTGNGSKSGYTAPVGISPYTMYLAGGDITEEELLKKADSGVYITDLSGLHAGANPISGDFSLQSAGFMVENGEKTTYVKSFTVAGNFYELLKNVVAVADNVTLPMPMGKTTFGSPTVWVDGLSVAGK